MLVTVVPRAGGGASRPLFTWVVQHPPTAIGHVLLRGKGTYAVFMDDNRASAFLKSVTRLVAVLGLPVSGTGKSLKPATGLTHPVYVQRRTAMGAGLHTYSRKARAVEKHRLPVLLPRDEKYPQGMTAGAIALLHGVLRYGVVRVAKS